MKTFEVKFTVYSDEKHTSSQSDLQWLATYVTAFNSQTAQAMIEAQYRGLAHVHSVSEHTECLC